MNQQARDKNNRDCQFRGNLPDAHSGVVVLMPDVPPCGIILVLRAGVGLNIPCSARGGTLRRQYHFSREQGGEFQVSSTPSLRILWMTIRENSAENVSTDLGFSVSDCADQTSNSDSVS